MRQYLNNFLKPFFFLLLFATVMVPAQAQVCEWRLANMSFINVDPDGAGPATGQVNFTLQIRTTSGTIANVNAISTGYSYQSALAMVPATPGCATVSNPANIVLSTAFSSAGFSFFANQCNVFTQSGGPETFDRRASGVLDGGIINLTDSWVDVFTVTLWTLGGTFPQGGYAMINSGAGGSPAEFTTYAVADDQANEYVVNTVTYDPALPLGATVVPVSFSGFTANCSAQGIRLQWSTASENRSGYFEIQRSYDGRSRWEVIGTRPAAGQSGTLIRYEWMAPYEARAFYRIRQVDQDGREQFSDTREKSCSETVAEVQLYPNPADQELYIRLLLDKPVRANLQILNAQGQIVRRVSATLTTGNQQIRIDVSDLPAGRYHIVSTDPSLPVKQAFVVVHP